MFLFVGFFGTQISFDLTWPPGIADCFINKILGAFKIDVFVTTLLSLLFVLHCCKTDSPKSSREFFTAIPLDISTIFCIIWASLMFMSPINLVLKHHIITECAAVMAGTASLVQSCQRWRCWTVRWETTMLVSGMLGDTIIVCSLLYNIQYVYVEQHYFVYTFIRIYLYIIYIYNGGRRTKRKPK